MVTIKNISEEAVAFAGYPAIAPGSTLDVTQEEADVLLLNDSMKLVEKGGKRSGSFKATEVE